MSISRRQFLGGLLGLAAAPAIVRADSLMRIWVPKNYMSFHIEPSMIIPGQEYSLSFWMKEGNADWHKVHRKYMWQDIKDGHIRVDMGNIRMNNPLVMSNMQLEMGKTYFN